MEVRENKSFIKYLTILAVVVFLRLIMSGAISGSAIECQEFVKFQYDEYYKNADGVNYAYPHFNISHINDYIEEYLRLNACTSLDYKVNMLSDSLVNVYMNCGEAKNIYYNYKEDRALHFSELVNDQSIFVDSVKKLLNLKYPTFVTDEVDILEGNYTIDGNGLVGSYDTQDYGNVSIRINNNVIRDMLVYQVQYDDEYENEVYTLDPNKKTVAFTFDDGPSSYDVDIIDSLVNSHSSATFFLVGNRLYNFKDSINKMIENNMEIGNHSFDHKYLKNLTRDKVLEEINSTNNRFYEITGKKMSLFRPPYGAMNNTYLKEAGVPSILWSIDTLDWKSRDAEKVYNSIIGSVKDGDIILMHSLYPSTRDAVKNVIPELYKMGYQIVSVSKLFELKGKTVNIGSSYWAVR